METSYNCAKWCSSTTYQKVNSSIVSKGAMNSFNEMFPLARVFPLAVMHTPCSFSKNLFSRERVKPCCFVTFNIIVSHICPENFIEITQVVQNIWRFSSSILTIFINFLGILIFPCYKETNEVSIEQVMSALLYFQHTLNRLFGTCINLYWY